jgi:LuxR family maltose regulon positive regulatory protein
LVERGVFVTVVDPPTRTMRFHELFRSVLEADLRRRDRSRWIDLHRRAASLWSARGDLTAAYQHLAAVGDSDRAQQFFVQPALDLVDDGDVDALRQFVRSLPRLDDVADPYLALDLALVAFYASGPAAAKPWCDRAGGLIDALDSGTGPQSSEQDREALTLRLHDMTCAVALLDADLDTAIKCVDVHRQLAAPVRGHDRFEKRFPILAARVMLAARRRNEAETWIGRAERIDGPELVSNATVPTLRAWQGWLDGRLHTAASLSEGALAWLDEHHVGPHHFAFDTLITTGWCRLSAGDSGGAMTLAERARSDARVLACAWNELQSAYLWARVALAGGDLAGALGAVEELRATVDFDACRPYADRVLGLEIEVLFEQRRHEEATRLINRLQPGPRERVLRARSGTVGDDALGSFLADRAGWPATERIQADLLLATVGSEPAPSAALSALVRDCADTGWVHPFLGFGPRVDRLLLSDAVGRIHPALRAVVASRPAAAGERTSTASSIALTERERTLLELLPTHLSYSEIGERLFLSVNTVKSNMKVLYRKLDANTRTQAVDAAERAGLL